MHTSYQENKPIAHDILFNYQFDINFGSVGICESKNIHLYFIQIYYLSKLEAVWIFEISLVAKK